MDKVFYVYEHVRPDRGHNGEVFYVGKGRGKRANNMAERNRHHKAIQAKLSRLGLCVEVRLVATELTESEAFALEVERIAFWRADGCDLANWTNGGEGCSGAKQSEETKAKKRAKLAGKERPEAHKEAMRGIPKSAEHKEKLRLANAGKTLSAETRAKISKAGKGRVRSLEACMKCSLAQKGRPKSPEAIAKVAAALRGRKRPPEAIKKAADARRGIPLSEEHKAALRRTHADPVLKASTAKKVSDAWTPERRAKQAEIAKTSAAKRVENARKRMNGEIV